MKTAAFFTLVFLGLALPAFAFAAPNFAPMGYGHPLIGTSDSIAMTPIRNLRG